MTGDYPFPDDIRNPNRTDPNPFAAEDPTLDIENAEEANVFAASSAATEYRPVYDRVLPDRAMLTVVLGAIGLLGSLSGWLWYVDRFDFSGVFMMPLFALAATLPALLISLGNLRAMKSGAMHIERRQWARLACFLGAVGLANGLLFLGHLIWLGWFYWW